MTGTPFRLRRWSMCNLHWYSPLFPRDRSRRLSDPPPIYNRYKLYVPDDQARDSYPSWLAQRRRVKFGRDRLAPFVWLGTDCGWEWLATRPVIYHVLPLYRFFNRLHEHVHTKHRLRRFDLWRNKR